jgi:hypothetical protein
MSLRSMKFKLRHGTLFPWAEQFRGPRARRKCRTTCDGLIATHRYGLKCHTFVKCRSFVRISEMNRGDLMSSRSERYFANAEKCQQCADVANTPGTKRLYGVLASQWRHLAEGADWTDEIGSRPLMRPLMEKIRHAHFLRQIDKAEGAIREFGMALEGEPLLTPKEHRQL